MKRRNAVIEVIVLLLATVASGQDRPANVVDPLVGTANDGQTFPATGVPFAMTQWTPATRDTQRKAVAPYYFADHQFRGFRGSHFLSGSATQDYGSVQIMTGRGRPDTVEGAPSVAFSHSDEQSKPFLYTIKFPGSGIEAALTGTEHCGMLQLVYRREGTYWIAVENFALPGDGEISIDPQHREMTSQSAVRRLYAGAGKLAGISGYAVLELDHAFEAGATWSGKDIHPGGTQQASSQGSPAGYVLFHAKAGEVVNIRIGTSFTNMESARANLVREIPDWNFDAVAQKAAAAWNSELEKIAITASDRDWRIFYTALYHAMLLPSEFSDASGTYPSFAGASTTEVAKYHREYDDFSIWDTFRALHPLFTIVEPERDGEMVQSLIDKAEQGGYLPIFPAWNSYTSEMTGDHAVAIIADAYFKGIKEFDIEKAYFYMRRNALETPSDPAEYRDGKGRRALQSYMKFGYIPLEDHVPNAFHGDEQVARTLDYAYDDFVVGKVAKALGKSEDASLFLKRSMNYRNVIDPATGFARGRHADGSWIEPFDPARTASYVTEGVPFQYSFYVLQDLKGLIALQQGKEAFVSKLDALFAQKLYEHGNEPSHHLAYLYDFAGAASKTQQHVHEIVDKEYSDGPGGLPGNDDAGQMSAWYCLSAMGFYPVTPGIPAYAIGTPRFAAVTISVGNGRQFEIVAHHLSAQNFYIRSVTLNGKRLNRFWLSHAEIVNGGKVEFEMSNLPSQQWPKSSDFPE
jgi:predicted alpha-1,2-mannosidase